jgi:hypothetical protein
MDHSSALSIHSTTQLFEFIKFLEVYPIDPERQKEIIAKHLVYIYIPPHVEYVQNLAYILLFVHSLMKDT